MTQAASPSYSRPDFPLRWLTAVVLVTAALAAAVFQRQWMPLAQRLVTGPAPAAQGGEDHDHAGHEHAHADHDDANSIQISPQARKNIGLNSPLTVRLQPFTKTITVPGMIVERPGRSTVEVTALMTGVVTRIYAIEGEAVEPGAKLFDLRLTHEDLVQSQSELLKTAEELDVVAREIRRIEDLIKDQALPGKQLLERQYEQQKLQAAMRAQRQALELHGLSEQQVAAILQQRRLLQDLVIAVPATTAAGGMSPVGMVFQVQSLKVSQGQHVAAGDTLAVLADHSELFIKGEAFERDLAEINRVASAGTSVSASLDTNGGQPETVTNLRLLYLAAEVDPESRTLDFYVRLPNAKLRDAVVDGHRFIAWRFRPGQRVQLELPIETLPDRIVLPAAAVAQDGPESYVFSPDGDHFDRRAIHVEYRDSQWVVVANDGSLEVGEFVVSTGAQQLQLALKNQAGGGVDPHAGHNH